MAGWRRSRLRTECVWTLRLFGSPTLTKSANMIVGGICLSTAGANAGRAKHDVPAALCFLIGWPIKIALMATMPLPSGAKSACSDVASG